MAVAGRSPYGLADVIQRGSKRWPTDRLLAEALDEQFGFQERRGEVVCQRVVRVGFVIVGSELTHRFDCADFHAGVCLEVITHDFSRLLFKRKLARFGNLQGCEGCDDVPAKRVGLAGNFVHLVFGELESDVCHEKECIRTIRNVHKFVNIISIGPGGPELAM